MSQVFDDATVSAVLAHMNSDHSDDNVLIARAFATLPDIASATMTGFDGDSGHWRVVTAGGEEHVVRVPWPGGTISERREVRREIVALYDGACTRLGLQPRPHA